MRIDDVGHGAGSPGCGGRDPARARNACPSPGTDRSCTRGTIPSGTAMPLPCWRGTAGRSGVRAPAARAGPGPLPRHLPVGDSAPGARHSDEGRPLGQLRRRSGRDACPSTCLLRPGTSSCTAPTAFTPTISPAVVRRWRARGHRDRAWRRPAFLDRTAGPRPARPRHSDPRLRPCAGRHHRHRRQAREELGRSFDRRTPGRGSAPPRPRVPRASTAGRDATSRATSWPGEFGTGTSIASLGYGRPVRAERQRFRPLLPENLALAAPGKHPGEGRTAGRTVD